MTGKLGTHYQDCYREHHECAVHEVERLRESLSRTAAKSRRRKSAIKQLQTALELSQALTRDLARAVAQLRERQ